MDRSRFQGITKSGVSKAVRQRGKKVAVVVVVVIAKNRSEGGMNRGGVEVIREVGGEVMVVG